MKAVTERWGHTATSISVPTVVAALTTSANFSTGIIFFKEFVAMSYNNVSETGLLGSLF
jgi:hypothetical protein